MSTKIQNLEQPGLRLYKLTRAGFVAKGTSFTRWCKENDVDRTTAHSAIIGRHNGPKGQALRLRLIRASGLSE